MEAKKSFWKKEWESILFFAVFLIAECCLIYNCYYNPKFEEIQKAKFENTKDKYEAENYLVTRCLSVLGGTIALFAFYLNWKRTNATEETNRIAEKNNDNNYWLSQFSKASELLKDENSLAARLSGIYLFEKIMNNNEEYHWAVIEILSAYVREKRHKSKFIHSEEEHLDWAINPILFDDKFINIVEERYEYDRGNSEIIYKICKKYNKIPIESDIQAILIVLGNRNRSMEKLSNIEPATATPIIKGFKIILNKFIRARKSSKNVNSITSFINDKAKSYDLETLIKGIVEAADDNGYENAKSCYDILSNIKQIDLSNTLLYKADFSKLKMDNMNFKNSIIADSILKSTSFVGTEFNEVFILEVEEFLCTCIGVKFHFAKFENSYFDYSYIEDSVFFMTKMYNTHLNGICFSNSKFINCSGHSVKMQHSYLLFVDFTDSDGFVENLISTNSDIRFERCIIPKIVKERTKDKPEFHNFIVNNTFK